MVKTMKELLKNVLESEELDTLSPELRVDIKVLAGMFEHGLDTNGMGGKSVKVNLFYPRNEKNPHIVDITLYDVRAANSIHVEFDFDRNGWVIKSDMIDPESTEDYPDEPEMHEVAFVDAWPGSEELSEQELKDKIWMIYAGGFEVYNYYADQADEDGLVAVYKAGMEEGRKGKTNSSARWLAYNIAEAWLKEPMHPEGLGYATLTSELLDDIFGGPITAEQVMEHLERHAKNRGYDYVFSVTPHYNVETNTTDQIIEWRWAPKKENDGA